MEPGPNSKKSIPRPTKAQLEAARGGRVADIIGPGLDVLFCGINPSLYSAVVGYHFARPGNRFWPTLFHSGFTPQLLRPEDSMLLLDYAIGITNLVERATANAAELAADELRAGGQRLQTKLERYRPRALAVLGVTAYRSAFGDPAAVIGAQDTAIAGVPVWVLPNPSGLNAHYQLTELAAVYADFRRAVAR